MDETDRRILRILQKDASLPVEQVAEQAHLSRNACWRRIKKLEEEGVVAGRVALVDPDKVGLGLTVFILVRTNQHESSWIAAFKKAIADLPQIIGVYRTSGQIDYILRAQVADMRAYDGLYQELIRRVSLYDVSASFVMEEIKETTELPV
jgi:Lrp/AsnC family transcriptional regulator